MISQRRAGLGALANGIVLDKPDDWQGEFGLTHPGFERACTRKGVKIPNGANLMAAVKTYKRVRTYVLSTDRNKTVPVHKQEPNEDATLLPLHPFVIKSLLASCDKGWTIKYNGKDSQDKDVKNALQLCRRYLSYVDGSSRMWLLNVDVWSLRGMLAELFTLESDAPFLFPDGLTEQPEDEAYDAPDVTESGPASRQNMQVIAAQVNAKQVLFKKQITAARDLILTIGGIEGPNESVCLTPEVYRLAEPLLKVRLTLGGEGSFECY